MRVYKFLSEKWGIQAIKDRRIKISLFHELNDPFDCHAVRFDYAYEREAWQKTIQNLGQSKGLTCFSGHFHNPLLWSHYANDHRGIALEFDIDDSVPLQKVVYATTFLDGRGFERLDKDQKIAIVQRAFSRKFLQWKYETEFRAFIDLDTKSKEGGKFFLGFNDDFRISKIILGPKNISDFSTLENVCHDLNVDIKRAFLSNKKYEVVCP